MEWLQLRDVANFGFAAVVAMFALVRLDATLNKLTRQIHLNTVVLAKLSGQNLTEIEAMLANGERR